MFVATVIFSLFQAKIIKHRTINKFIFPENTNAVEAHFGQRVPSFLVNMADLNICCTSKLL